MYLGSVTPPTNADCMSRLYGVEPHTDFREVWGSGHNAQKPGSQVHSEGFGLQSLLCPAFSCPHEPASTFTLFLLMVVIKD